MNINSDISIQNAGTAAFNCVRCLTELPKGQSPFDYAKQQVSVTADGNLQVWCNRHDINIALIDIQGQAQDLAHTCDACEGHTH